MCKSRAPEWLKRTRPDATVQLGSPRAPPTLIDLSTPPVAPGVDRIGIRIDPDQFVDSPMWAFVTVTNNDTQHVTVVSPQ